MSDFEGRRYEVLQVLGEGGYGRVYRARMEGQGGFTKEVAIKLLNRVDASDEILERFRDESRILGLIRDRAIISVEPPTRLDGQWAVVMEYVEGVTAGKLVSVGPLPAKVCLEIVQEVARALDRVYQIPGPSGSPLKLLHRDLKPDNLQITPAGDVKILDFGIARANFTRRESRTTENIAGTVGYIAPERMDGEELPAGDVYSLGVVLQVLLVGERLSRRQMKDRWGQLDPYVRRALDLAKSMSAPDPEDRPSAAQVEIEAAALASATPGQPLRYWAREAIPEALDYGKDDLVGQVLSETMSSAKSLIQDDRGLTRSTGTQLAAAAMFGTAGFAGLIVAMLSVGLVAWTFGYYMPRQQVARGLSEPTLVDATPVKPTPVANPEAETTVPEPAAETAPQPAPVATTPSPRPRPVTAPKPAARTYEMTFSSVPMGAEVFLDGKALGKTPVLNTPVSEGKHTLKMVMDGQQSTRQITVNKRGATKYIWQGVDEWQVSY